MLLRRLRRHIVSASVIMASFASTGSAAATRGVVLYSGKDLRVADHLPLLSAHRECESVNHVICLDPRDYRNTEIGYEKKSLRSFGFMQEAVKDLKLSLQEGGSDLDVLIGRTEEVLPAIVPACSAPVIVMVQQPTTCIATTRSPGKRRLKALSTSSATNACHSLSRPRNTAGVAHCSR